MTTMRSGPEVSTAIKPRDLGTAYLLCLGLGVFGAHKFYLGQTRMGLAYAGTAAFLGLGLLWDVATLPAQVRACNEALLAGSGHDAVDGSGRVPPKGADVAESDADEKAREAAADAVIQRYLARQRTAASDASAGPDPSPKPQSPAPSFGRRRSGGQP